MMAAGVNPKAAEAGGIKMNQTRIMFDGNIGFTGRAGWSHAGGGNLWEICA